jgi:flagellar biosynthetic protein FlhB
MADDYGEKTEAPTPRRRQEAREQGNIARSPDLTAAVLILAAMFMLSWYGPGLVNALRALMQEMLSARTLTNFDTSAIFVTVLAGVRLVATALAPLLVGAMIVAILANVVQVGLFFNLKRLQPQLNALNPVKGISRLFSRGNGLVHLVMNLLKLSLVTLVAYSAIVGRMDQILAAQKLSFTQIFLLAGSIVYSIAIRIGLVLLVLAIIDYAWQRWRREQQLKMTKQEVKEEMRRMEGDPMIKQRRRQIALQRIKQRIQQDVPKADVIVTNPTHFAVALKYDPESMHAPRVVAKGADFIAQLIREVAIANGIPILERAPLARALYKLVDVGHEIPEQFYAAVAEILAYVYELSGKLQRAQGRVPEGAAV